ncbi:5744_t:CDS:2 [Ambispora leptoticha]|uniref:5744_t:CDS:1 n=1 Tax=Ambispora leptoticha TaxID=144679 RepID=A0A9N8YSC3_9GLOM|nr:5744_t:CDS:2 [Ambispora leptoticha]
MGLDLDTDFDDEFNVVIACLITSTLSTFFIIYKVITSFTRLRFACLIETLIIQTCAIVHLIRCLTNSISTIAFWILVALENAVYTTITVIFILDMGRKFYQNIYWNTLLFKLILFGIVLFNILNFITATFLITDVIKAEPINILWMVQMIVGILTMMLSFGYTFAPVIISHWNPNNPKLQNTGHIKPMNAAVATWYLVVLGILCSIYLALYIASFFEDGDAIEYLSVKTSVDSIIRTVITVVLASSPPKRFIEIIKSIVINRRPLNNFIRDRGVVSTGMIGDSPFTNKIELSTLA